MGVIRSDTTCLPLYRHLGLFYSEFMRSVFILALAGCLGASAQAPEEDAAARLNQARTYFAGGDIARARREAEALHEADPQDVPAAVLLANCYIKMGRMPGAVEVLKPLEAAHSSDLELEYSLAFAQIESGETADGVVRMEKVAKATHSASAWTVAGGARLHLNDFAQAKSDLDAAIALNPNLPGLNTMAGKVRYALGDADGAVPFFQAALRANPSDYEANLYTGLYRLNQGDYEGARPVLELAVQLQPDAPLARLKLAELNALTGRYDEAVRELEKLEQANPDWAEPHVRLAALYYKLHRPEDGQRERTIVEQIEAKQQQAGPPKQ
jgi:tetratricopeptide (TPR) repeat protein